jgi:hypothetical protein
MKIADQNTVTAIILNNVPEGAESISETDLKKLITEKVEVKNWEDVQRILAYLVVTGSLWKIGVFDVKYSKREVRKIHP